MLSLVHIIGFVWKAATLEERSPWVEAPADARIALRSDTELWLVRSLQHCCPAVSPRTREKVPGWASARSVAPVAARDQWVAHAPSNESWSGFAAA